MANPKGLASHSFRVEDGATNLGKSAFQRARWAKVRAGQKKAA
jgi:hypothetical protein